jgi:hypothetical protein
VAKTKEPEKRGRGRPRIHPLPVAKTKPRQAAKPSKTVKARAVAPSPNGKTSLVFDFSNMTPEQRGTITAFVIEQCIATLATDNAKSAYLAFVGQKVGSYFPIRIGGFDATAPGVYVEVKPETKEPEVVPEPVATTAVDSSGQEHAAIVAELPEPSPSSDQPASDPTYAPPMPEHDIPETDPH